MRNYDFRLLTQDDLTLLRRWYSAAHVKVWWPDTDAQIARITADMENPQVAMHIVELSHLPFAFISDFDARTSAKPEFADLPVGTRVVETFVGNPDFLGPGHAAGYIEAWVRALRRSYSLVAVGPITTDTRAISIYRQAGFHNRRLAPTRDGKLVQVMTRL
ncbi:aminoglycoside 6'-N-acetyltransferase [Yoonia tamlensis]|uniref:Aminoglycoside 6'-N-acetyltransferase n=1 Tax=Yoonia tamlensis TaxID=390270 RepID=A0A1I6FUR1_9RHOB|nr:GNAT family N-acetyltransferase [Yoonia tamlensis]SFR33626.1 aminoglycoside 6'-N-acetyltransferase [Yoonia tamlensis]